MLERRLVLVLIVVIGRLRVKIIITLRQDEGGRFRAASLS